MRHGDASLRRLPHLLSTKAQGGIGGQGSLRISYVVTCVVCLVRGEGGLGDGGRDSVCLGGTLSVASSSPPLRPAVGRLPVNIPIPHRKPRPTSPHARCLPPWSSTARRPPSRPGTAGAAGGETTSVRAAQASTRDHGSGAPSQPGAAGVSISKGQRAPGNRCCGHSLAPRPAQRPRQSKAQAGLKRQQGCPDHWRLQLVSDNPQRDEISLKTSRLVSGGLAVVLGAPGPWLREDF